MNEQPGEYERELAEQASEWIQAMNARLGDVEGPAVNTEVLCKLGMIMDRVVRPDMTDSLVIDAAWKHEGPDTPLIRTMIAKPPENAMMLGSYRWLKSGLPQVTMGHKYCAALLATGVPEEVLDLVVAPWRAFVIQVPNGLIYCDDGKGRQTEVRAVLVAKLDGSATSKWCYIAMTTSTVLLWRFSPNIRDLLRETLEANAYDGYSFLLDFEDIDDRAGALIGRLVVNSCLAMSDPTNLKAPKPMSSKAKAKAAKRGLPTVTNYVLGKPIKLDCRQAVAAYGRGERRAPSVQVLVRGHWKRQPCGPGRQQRKLIHVEPYWRGPEDAPINVREVHLEKGTGTP
jgi:hypothetical protein